MAYAPIPNIVTVHTPKIGCNELSMNTLNEILNSESVKRLLNRQNVYLQTPLTDGSVASDLASSRNSLYEKGQNGYTEKKKSKAEKKPELSVIPILNLGEKEKLSRVDADEEHLLPSKTEGKSAIALLPLRREEKCCGHMEECENVLCDVDIERLVIGEDVTPLIAINLDSVSDIDAPVSKHCDNNKCDALSIDHDRCRRAVVRCNRCDRSTRCDICLVTLKTRKSKMMHKNCKMRPEYRHNKISRSQLMKDRMRMRELQILKCGKFKRNDYSDPINGHDRAFQTLQRNSELIVIPKATLSIQHHPTIRITSVTGAVSPVAAQSPNAPTTAAPTTAAPTTAAPPPATSAKDTFGKLLPRYPFFPGQKLIVGKSMSNAPTKDDHPSAKSQPRQPPRRFISIRRTGNNADAPTTNYTTNQLRTTNSSSSSSSSSSSTTSSTPYLMPIRVVPITGLTANDSSSSSPSPSPAPLVARRVPKFCLVAQTPTNNTPETKVRAKVQKTGTSKMSSRKSESDFILKRYKSGMRRGRRKKNASKRTAKSFECTYCSKRFSTDWYFKLHIAKHKGEIKFNCIYCKKPFMHHCNMRKHVMTMHKQEAANDEEYANAVDNNAEFLHCFNCKLVFNTRLEKDNHRCSIVCLRCHARLTDTDLIDHLKTKHEMSEDKALEEIERQKRQKIQRDFQNRGNKKREFVKQQARAAAAAAVAKTKESSKTNLEERENGNLKRKKGASNSKDRSRGGSKQEGNKNQMKKPVRKLTRRRNHNLVDRSEKSATADNQENSEEARQQNDSTGQLVSNAAETVVVSR